jgi:3-dehydroquinate synthase
MISLNVGLGERSYPIYIENGAIGRAQAILEPITGSQKLVIITDSRVAAAQRARLALTGETIILEPGEATKSWGVLAKLCDQLLVMGIERGDYLVAFGGGVIGDLVGFAASLIKRGCNFIQIPTTLLAQVDSSVGGKTAINTSVGKNLIGAFYQPKAVLIDPEALDTLPERDVKAGYAEVLKYGLINDPEFYEWCETNAAKLIAGDADARMHAIQKSVKAKADIVAADERETRDVRALLNLGHTFGHALEAETGFSDALYHGEGVAAGMALAHRFSARMGLCPGIDAMRLTQHLSSLGMPHGLHSITASGADLVNHMLHDKKMAAGTLPFILSRGIGQAFVDKSVDLSDVVAFLDEEAR